MMNSEKISLSSKNKKKIAKSFSKQEVKKTKSSKSAAASKFVKKSLPNGRISKGTKQFSNVMSPVVKVRKLELKNMCPDFVQRVLYPNNESSETNDKKENGISKEKKCGNEESKSHLSIRERLKRFVKRKSTSKRSDKSSVVDNSKKTVEDVLKIKRPITANAKCNSEAFTNSGCISFHQKELNFGLPDQRDSKDVKSDFPILDQSIRDKNSLSSLCLEINEIAKLRTSNNTSFVTDVLKIKPIIVNSSNDFECNSDTSVVLEASMVLAAFRYFEYQRTAHVSPSNLHANENIWENNYAVINQNNLSCSKNFQNVENASNNLNLSNECLRSQNMDVENSLQNKPDECIEIFLNEIPMECVQGTNVTGLQDICVSSDHNNVDLAEYSNDTVTSIIKKSSKNVTDEKCTENYFREIHEDAAVSADGKSQNDLEKAKDQNLLPEKNPLIISLNSNSNSRGLYETDILGADVLDYEPSEISEEEISEGESLAADVHKCEANGDLEFVKPMFEKELDNTIGNKNMYYEISSKKPHHNEQDILNTEECEIYSECTDDDNYIETSCDKQTISITEIDETYSECSNNEEYMESYNELTHDENDENFYELNDKIIKSNQNFSEECEGLDECLVQSEKQNNLPSNNGMIDQNLPYSFTNNGSEFQQEPLFTNRYNHTSTSDSSLSSVFSDKFHVQSSTNKSLNSSKNAKLGVFSKELKNFNPSMCGNGQSFNEKLSNTIINKSYIEMLKPSSSKRSIHSTDDSDSDSERSFKRRKCNAMQEHIQESISADESSQSQIPYDLNSLEEVILHIREHCGKGKIEEAIRIANKYISVSVGHVQKVLFKEFFFCAIDYINDLEFSLNEDFCLETIKSCMEIFYYYNLYDSNMCSVVILECLCCNLAVLNASQVLSFCQKNEIPVNSEAISSFVNVMKSTEMSLNDIISFLDYVTNVCKQPAPKFLIKEILELFINGKESSFSPGFFLMCKFLCSISPNEVDKTDLQNFIKFCIKNDFWKEIADFFCVWADKNFIIDWLCETFAFQIEDVGLLYEKLAEEMFGRESGLSDHLLFTLGQIGVSLMLEAFSKQLYESAFEILCTLHKHDVNYFELQKPVCTANTYIKALSEPTDVIVFTYTVAFVALDICLNLKRPKDAYKVLCKIPTQMTVMFDDELNLNIKRRQFYYLLTLALQLHSVDHLGLGLEALQNLVSKSEKEFSVGELNEYSKDVQAVFNKYLISFINGHQDELIKKFYLYTYGERKDLFVLENQVIRAILIFLIKNDLMNEVEKFYVLGYSRNVYEVGKQIFDKYPRSIIIRSSWTSEEIRYVFLKFVESLTPILKLKPPEINFNQWFAMNISLKEAKEKKYDIDYLNETARDLKSAKERICNVLIDLDSNMKWHEDGCKILNLIPETFYNFWILYSQKFSSEPKTEKIDKCFKIPDKVRVSFGNGVPQIEPTNQCNEPDALEFTSDEHASEMSCSDNIQESILEQNKVNNLSPLKVPLNNNELNTPPKTFLDNNDSVISPKKISNCSDQIMLSRSIFKDSSLITPPKANSEEVTSLSNSYSEINCSKNASSQSSPKKLINSNVQQRTSKGLNSKRTSYSPSRKISFKSIEKSPQNDEPKKLPDPDDLKNIKITIQASQIQNAEPCADSEVSKLELQPETISPIHNVKLTLKSISRMRRQPVTSTPAPNMKSLTQRPTFKRKLKTNFRVSNVVLPAVKPTSEVRLQPQIFKPSVVKPSIKPNVPDLIFQRITNFLKSKVILKRKDLSPEQQQETAFELACTFIQNNVVSSLDKKIMKLLNEFADKLIS